MTGRLILTLTLVASTAYAGATIELVPEQPGPYFGGETVEVDVYATVDSVVYLRLLQFDFSATEPALEFGENFDFTCS